MRAIAAVAGGQRAKAARLGLNVDPDSYLCTGMDVYLTREPCIMCSMALLHARVRRIFFAVRNERGGGLGSRIALHQTEAVNHRFEVIVCREGAVRKAAFDALNGNVPVVE